MAKSIWDPFCYTLEIEKVEIVFVLRPSKLGSRDRVCSCDLPKNGKAEIGSVQRPPRYCRIQEGSVVRPPLSGKVKIGFVLRSPLKLQSQDRVCRATLPPELPSQEAAVIGLPHDASAFEIRIFVIVGKCKSNQLKQILGSRKTNQIQRPLKTIEQV